MLSFSLIDVKELTRQLLYQSWKITIDHISKTLRVEKSGVFLTNFKVFGNLVKYGLKYIFSI